MRSVEKTACLLALAKYGKGSGNKRQRYDKVDFWFAGNKSVQCYFLSVNRDSAHKKIQQKDCVRLLYGSL